MRRASPPHVNRIDLNISITSPIMGNVLLRKFPISFPNKINLYVNVETRAGRTRLYVHRVICRHIYTTSKSENVCSYTTYRMGITLNVIYTPGSIITREV